jgi:hypothetical protein
MAKDAYLFGKIRERDLVTFLDGLLSALGRLAKTPASNKELQDDLNNLHKFVFSVFHSGAAELAISELHGEIQINDKPLSVDVQSDPVVNTFGYFMLEKNVRSLQFLSGMTQREFVRFLEGLMHHQTASNIAEELAKEGINSILVEPQVLIREEPAVDFSDLEVDEEVFFEAVAPEENPAPEDAETSARSTKEAGDESGRRRLKVRVVVGTHALKGALVRVLGTNIPPAICNEDAGAVIPIAPGDYELEVRYEEFKVKRKITIRPDADLEMVVDLQQVFDY